MISRKLIGLFVAMSLGLILNPDGGRKGAGVVQRESKAVCQELIGDACPDAVQQQKIAAAAIRYGSVVGRVRGRGEDGYRLRHGAGRVGQRHHARVDGVCRTAVHVQGHRNHRLRTAVAWGDGYRSRLLGRDIDRVGVHVQGR